MKLNPHISRGLPLLALAAALAAASPLSGQSGAPQSKPKTPAADRFDLDRMVAVVNTDIILESDIDAEQRFEAFQPLRAEAPESRDKLIERLIDRALIVQQMKQQPQPPIPDAQVDAQLAMVRKDLPECSTYHCETDAGWAKFVSDHGFTIDEVRSRWRTRMEVLRFIEERFRMGIRISQTEIDNYYKNKLTPAYAKNHATPPAQVTINDRIQEILLQQQVTGLLDDWLKSLRAQGSVRVLSAEDAAR